MNFTDIQTALVTDTRNRIAIIAGIAVLTLGGNLLAMVLGTPESLLPLPTLPLTIPIIIASYWYPRRGIPPVSVCFASVYAVTTYFLSPPGPPLLAYTILLRAILLVLIGGVVAFLATKLRESEQQMNQIIEFLPDATFAIDREGGKVIAWNRAIEEMTGGVKKEAMLGRGGLRVRRTLLRRTAAAACRPGSPRRSRDRVPSVRRSGDVLVAEIHTPLLRGGGRGGRTSSSRRPRFSTGAERSPGGPSSPSGTSATK